MKCSIYDTPGNENYNGINETYYRKADAILLVYDISNKESFDRIKQYFYPKIKELCKKDIPILLLGNKLDKENEREVSIEEGASFAVEKNYLFKECSCLKNENVSEAFEALIDMWNIGNKSKNSSKTEIIKNKRRKISQNEELIKKRFSFNFKGMIFKKRNSTNNENIILKKLKQLIYKDNDSESNLSENSNSSLSSDSILDRISSNLIDKKTFEEKYKNLEKIGEGSYGEIFKSKIEGKDEYRAIKIIDIERYKNILINNFSTNLEEGLDKFKHCIFTEIENMKICSQENKNINSINFYEYFYDDKKLAYVMELCDDNLRDILKKKKSGFNVEEIYDILQQLNNTFKIMVENKIIHRDLKLENILVKYTNEEKTKFIIKLADYGVSRKLNTLTQSCMTRTGTCYTMAPEILMNKTHNNKCDLWSLGIIIYMLFFKERPNKGDTEAALINNFKNIDKTMKNTGDKLLDDLIKKLLKVDKKKRISWEEYFKHPFFKKTNKK